MIRRGLLAAVLLTLPRGALANTDTELDLVLKAQAQRIEMIGRVLPGVVCIFDSGHRGGGSGVLIDVEGYGLTNYHVVAGMMDSRRGLGGLSDGKLYELEVLGIDPTGDMAMFRLIGRDTFPYAPLGDSDKIRVGDAAIAMGNPFVLSEDYAPTVTLGMVTGVHRYQWGVGNNLIYSDCIQIDAAINPGNSGGPLFNTAGEVIGINGRISVNTRGRFNVGFGYAISSNQIRRFIPALRAGLLARHGTLQATVEHRDGLVFTRLVSGASGHDAGIRLGDKLLTVDGIPIQSPNHFASVLGTYPADYHVLLEIERGGKPIEVIARLDPITPALPQPFTVNREANLRQVRRLLGLFQRTVVRDGAERPTSWRCMLTREYRSGAATAGNAAEGYEMFWTRGRSIRVEQHHEDGSVEKVIEYDDKSATQRAGMGEEAFELTAEVRMIYGAMYIVQGRLLTPLDELDLTDVTHVGGDVLVGQSERAASRGSGTTLGSPPLELIEWPLAGEAVATLAFDESTHRVVRISVCDVPSGARATVDLLDYRDIGGIVWPCIVVVHGDGFAYRDTFSGWELSP